MHDILFCCFFVFRKTDTEKQLVVSPQQWNQLMTLNDGKSKFLELSFPFSANPNVKINTNFAPDCKPMIVFAGKSDAVDSAYQYFKDHLQMKCELPVDR